MVEETSIPSEENLEGLTLKDVHILKKVGTGGMGDVYKARQTRLDRIVAIKVLKSSLTHDKEFIQRFYREARAAAVINHPNIVQIFDVDEADGKHFITMEFIEGLPLSYLVERRGQLSVDTCIRIIEQCLRALQSAHSKGIVHRDIKSENIMITKNFEVKITDFGIAKQVGRDVTLTTAGAVMGTPRYMSPEQARGEKNIDHRSDLYSLGVVFFYVLTGQQPYPGDTPLKIVHQHASSKPPPNVLTFNPNVPVSVAKIVRRMMEKDRDKRYQSAQEVLLDLITTKRQLVEMKKQVTEQKTEKRLEKKLVRTTGPVKRSVKRLPRVVIPLALLPVFVIVVIIIVLSLPGGQRRHPVEERLKETKYSGPFALAKGEPTIVAREKLDPLTFPYSWLELINVRSHWAARTGEHVFNWYLRFYSDSPEPDVKFYSDCSQYEMCKIMLDKQSLICVIGVRYRTTRESYRMQVTEVGAYSTQERGNHIEALEKFLARNFKNIRIIKFGCSETLPERDVIECVYRFTRGQTSLIRRDVIIPASNYALCVYLHAPETSFKTHVRIFEKFVRGIKLGHLAIETGIEKLLKDAEVFASAGDYKNVKKKLEETRTILRQSGMGSLMQTHLLKIENTLSIVRMVRTAILSIKNRNLRKAGQDLEFAKVNCRSKDVFEFTMALIRRTEEYLKENWMAKKFYDALIDHYNQRKIITPVENLRRHFYMLCVQFKKTVFARKFLKWITPEIETLFIRADRQAEKDNKMGAYRMYMQIIQLYPHPEWMKKAADKIEILGFPRPDVEGMLAGISKPPKPGTPFTEPEEPIAPVSEIVYHTHIGISVNDAIHQGDTLFLLSLKEAKLVIYSLSMGMVTGKIVVGKKPWAMAKVGERIFVVDIETSILYWINISKKASEGWQELPEPGPLAVKKFLYKQREHVGIVTESKFHIFDPLRLKVTQSIKLVTPDKPSKCLFAISQDGRYLYSWQSKGTKIVVQDITKDGEVVKGILPEVKPPIFCSPPGHLVITPGGVYSPNLKRKIKEFPDFDVLHFCDDAVAYVLKGSKGSLTAFDINYLKPVAEVAFDPEALADITLSPRFIMCIDSSYVSARTLFLPPTIEDKIGKSVFVNFFLPYVDARYPYVFFTSTPPKTAHVGRLYEYKPKIYGARNIVITLQGHVPKGMKVSDGRIRWVPKPPQSGKTYEGVIVVVCQDEGIELRQPFSITVRSPPINLCRLIKEAKFRPVCMSRSGRYFYAVDITGTKILVYDIKKGASTHVKLKNKIESITELQEVLYCTLPGKRKALKISLSLLSPKYDFGLPGFDALFINGCASAGKFVYVCIDKPGGSPCIYKGDIEGNFIKVGEIKTNPLWIKASPCSRYVLWGVKKNTATLYKLIPGGLKKVTKLSVSFPTTEIIPWEFSKDSKYIFCPDKLYTISGRLVARYDGRLAPVYGSKYYIVIDTKKAKVSIYRTKTQELIETIPAPQIKGILPFASAESSGEYIKSAYASFKYKILFIHVSSEKVIPVSITFPEK